MSGTSAIGSAPKSNQAHHHLITRPTTTFLPGPLPPYCQYCIAGPPPPYYKYCIAGPPSPYYQYCIAGPPPSYYKYCIAGPPPPYHKYCIAGPPPSYYQYCIAGPPPPLHSIIRIPFCIVFHNCVCFGSTSIYIECTLTTVIVKTSPSLKI